MDPNTIGPVKRIKGTTQLFLQGVFKSSKLIAKAIGWVGYALAIFMVLVTFFDVTGRYFFSKPILGSLDLIELAMGVLCGCAIFHTTVTDGHVIVDLFLVKFSRHTQIIINSLGSFLAFAIWAAIAPKIYILGVEAFASGAHSSVLFIPKGPFVCIMGVELFLCCLAALIKVIPHFQLENKKEPNI